MLNRLSALAVSTALMTSPAIAQNCGGSFSNFVNGLKEEAIAKGHSRESVDRFFASARKDNAVFRLWWYMDSCRYS